MIKKKHFVQHRSLLSHLHSKNKIIYLKQRATTKSKGQQLCIKENKTK